MTVSSEYQGDDPGAWAREVIWKMLVSGEGVSIFVNTEQDTITITRAKSEPEPVKLTWRCVNQLCTRYLVIVLFGGTVDSIFICKTCGNRLGLPT